MSQHFRVASEFIERALAEGHSVLVHCQQGISRSSTLLIAFLMHSRRMGLAEAYTLVRSARMVAKPKANFLRQLVKFGNELEAARLHKQNLAEAQSVKAAVQQNVKALEDARTAPAASPSAGAGVAAAAVGSASPAAPAPVAAATAAAAAASPLTASPTAGTHSPLEAVDVAPGLFIMNPAAAAPSTSSPPNPVDASEGPRRERALKQMQQRTHSEAAAVKRKQASSMDVQTEAAPAAAVAGTGTGTGAADGSSGGSDSDSAMGEREAANNQKRRRIIKHAEATAVNVAAEAQLQHDEAARTASESPPIIAPLTQLNLDRLA